MGRHMKKLILAACLAGVLAGCGREEKGTGTMRYPETINEPSGSAKSKLHSSGSSNTIGTARPQSYESTSTPQHTNR